MENNLDETILSEISEDYIIATTVASSVAQNQGNDRDSAHNDSIDNISQVFDYLNLQGREGSVEDSASLQSQPLPLDDYSIEFNNMYNEYAEVDQDPFAHNQYDYDGINPSEFGLPSLTDQQSNNYSTSDQDVFYEEQKGEHLDPDLLSHDSHLELDITHSNSDSRVEVCDECLKLGSLFSVFEPSTETYLSFKSALATKMGPLITIINNSTDSQSNFVLNDVSALLWQGRDETLQWCDIQIKLLKHQLVCDKFRSSQTTTTQQDSQATQITQPSQNQQRNVERREAGSIKAYSEVYKQFYPRSHQNVKRNIGLLSQSEDDDDFKCYSETWSKRKPTKSDYYNINKKFTKKNPFDD